MATISVVFHTEKGHTKAVAEHVAAGARSLPKVTVNLIQITGEQVVAGRFSDQATLATLDASDAIVFGCPTYMGSVSAVFKAFIEATFMPAWIENRWKDKIGAGFTNSASQSGDKLSSLLQLAVNAMQHGMIWVGIADFPGNNWSGGTANDINRLGSWVGLMSQSNGDQDATLTPSLGDRETAHRFGQRIAGITKRWIGEGGYETQRVHYNDPDRPRVAKTPA